MEDATAGRRKQMSPSGFSESSPSCQVSGLLSLQRLSLTVLEAAIVLVRHADDTLGRRHLGKAQLCAGCRMQDVPETLRASMPAKPGSASIPFCSCPQRWSLSGSRRCTPGGRLLRLAARFEQIAPCLVQAEFLQSEQISQGPGGAGDEGSLALSQALEPVLTPTGARGAQTSDQRCPRPQHALLPLHGLAALGLAVLGEDRERAPQSKPRP